MQIKNIIHLYRYRKSAKLSQVTFLTLQREPIEKVLQTQIDSEWNKCLSYNFGILIVIFINIIISSSSSSSSSSQPAFRKPSEYFPAKVICFYAFLNPASQKYFSVVPLNNHYLYNRPISNETSAVCFKLGQYDYALTCY